MHSLFLEYSWHYSNRFDNWFLVDGVVVMGDVFVLVCNFHVPLGLKVGCPSSGAGCDIAWSLSSCVLV
jgi:hypothetical protein